MSASPIPLETRNLLAMFAHEFQTPLTAIKGYAQLLQRGHMTSREDIANCSGIIVQQTNRVIRTLQDAVLAVSAAVGAEPLAETQFAVGTLICEAIERLDIADRGRVHVDVAHDLHVQADRRLTTGIVLHLLQSMLKYSEPTARVGIGADPVDANVRVWIRLAGESAAAEKWRNMLRRDFTVDDDGDHGSGLGFYLARLLVEAQGSELVAHGTKGGGLEFAFCLPRNAESD